MLHVYTINGEELANVDTSVGRADRMQQILCVAFSQAIDWDPQNVIITGSSDGVVRVCAYDKCNIVLLHILCIAIIYFIDVVYGICSST